MSHYSECTHLDEAEAADEVGDERQHGAGDDGELEAEGVLRPVVRRLVRLLFLLCRGVGWVWCG